MTRCTKDLSFEVVKLFKLMKKTKRYRDEVKKQNNVQKTRNLTRKIEYTSLL